MPNWVYNTLVFKSSKDLDKVWKGMQVEFPDGNSFSYESIIPSPRTREECPAGFLVENGVCIERDDEKPWMDWYKWRNYYWGVKWDACDADTNFINSISFDSPWDRPNDELFQGIADKFGVSFTSHHIYEENDIEKEFEWYSTNSKNRMRKISLE